MERRDVRYQAAVLRDDHVLLLKVFDRSDGSEFWLLPGGGREPGEGEEACLRRELREETGLDVAIGPLLVETPDIPEGMYDRLRTYHCTIIAGEAQPGSEPEVDRDGQATIRDVGWFDLRDPSCWEPSIFATRGTADQLLRLRAALGYTQSEPKPAQWGPNYGSVFAEPGVAEAYCHRPPYPPAAIVALTELLAPVAPARVLDAGCGTGFVARPLAPLVAHVDAVDIAATMLAAGRAAPGGDHPHLRWACSPLETFAADPPYALIVAGSSLHWMEWKLVLPRFAAWLAPGGLLALLDEHSEPTPWGTEVGPVIARFSTNPDFRPYSTRTIADELTQRGLFAERGSRQIEPVPFTQTVAEYIASFHARNGLAPNRMGDSASEFDAALVAILARHCPDGLVRLQVGARLIWGTPLAPE
jgi:8-oxo-dGTP pyrophosphatase MutT (NUDIX family)/SAM-dependent methyltransferase